MQMTARAIEHQPIRRLKRAEWDDMVKAGVFREDERIELVFGQVVEMSPIGTDHIEAVYRLHRLLLLALGDRRRRTVRRRSPRPTTPSPSPTST
jgi:Uma2 family endonuclease